MADAVAKDYPMVKDLLGEGETVELEIVEHRLGGAKMLSPAHIFGTNYGIIVIRKSAMGLHTDYKIMKYGSITDVKLERGPMFCRIHFSMEGEQEDLADPQKWLVGIKYADALDLIHLVNRMEQKPVHEVAAPD